MNQTINIIELAERCPNAIISISAKDLVDANKELVTNVRRELEQLITDEKSETYPSVEKVAEMLDVSKATLWRWEKNGYLVPVRIGGKVRYKMSDVKGMLDKKGV